MLTGNCCKVKIVKSVASSSMTDNVLIGSLDLGNPLYLHPSDTTGNSLISVKLVGTENYRIWSSAMKLALQTKNKVGFINGSCVKTAYANSDVLSQQWDRCNAVVLSWILGSVSEELYLGQVFSESLAVVWTELKETYDKVDGSIVYNLLHKIHSIKQGGSSVSDYYHRINSLWREFDTLTKLPNCTCDASAELLSHNSLLKLMQFLMGLDDVYQPIRSTLLTRDQKCLCYGV